MQKDFNFLISYPRFHERDAIAEIWYVFTNIGEEDVRAKRTPFPGLLTAKSSSDPVQNMIKLRNLIEEDSTFLRFALKFIPIEVVIETTLENIIKITEKFEKRIDENETFRITLKKRRSSFESQELIVEVANHIDRKVNLSHPDKIVMIQILGELTGMSLLKPEQILSKAEFDL